MKRTITTLALVTLLTGAALPAFAESNGSENGDVTVSGTTSVRIDLKDAVEAKKQELENVREKFTAQVKSDKQDIKNAVEEKQSEMRDIRSEFRGDILKMQIGRTVRMLTAAADRFEKLIARVDSRIAKVKATGADTTAAESASASAKTSLADARVKIQAIASLEISVSSTTASTTVKANLEEARTDAQAVKTSLNAAKSSLLQALAALRGLGATGTSTESR